MIRTWVSRLSYSRVEDTLTWRVLSNAGWASAAAPITVGLGIVQIGMLARMLGPGGIGTLALFVATSGLFSSVFTLTSAETTVVYVTKALEEKDRLKADHLIRYCYFVDFSSSLVAFGCVVLSALVVPKLLNLDAGQGKLLVLYGLTLVFQSTYWVSHSLLRVADRFSWIFYQSVTHSVIKTVAVAWLFVSGATLAEVVFALVGLTLLDGVGLYIFANMAMRRKGLRMTRQSTPLWRVPREVWGFQLLGHGRQLAKSMSRYLDLLMIGYIASPVQVGFYRAGKQISDQIKLPGQGFVNSLFPEYSRLYFSGDMDRLRRLVRRFVALTLVLGLLAGLALWFGAELIIRIILGDGFLPAKQVIRILMVSAVVLLVMSPVYSLPAAVGRAAPALRSAIAATCVQVILILWLVPTQGALGAAWSWVAYAVTWSVVLLPSIVKVLRSPGVEPCQRDSFNEGHEVAQSLDAV